MTVSMDRLSLLFFVLAILFSVGWPVDSFTADLIHRDSPQSPFYDPSTTKWDRLNGALRRSASRAAILYKKSSNSPKDIQSPLSVMGGEFFMKLSIGTPPVTQIASVDTYNDLTWFQCQPCKSCFTQVSPIYDPKHSTTYRNISCTTSTCKVFTPDLHNQTCDNTLCGYNEEYAYSRSTKGYIASETFTFKSAVRNDVSIPNVLFGCGYNNTGTGILENISDGVIGLGCGKRSFINQASKHMMRKFSYCLAPFSSTPPFYSSPNATGTIGFGKSVHVKSPGAAVTPLKLQYDLYFITLESISVNNKSFALSEVQEYPGDENSDMNLNIGIIITELPDGVYDRLSLEVQKTIQAKPLEGVHRGLYHLCYRTKDNIKFPKIIFKFKWGAEIEFTEMSTSIHVDPDTVCLAIISSGFSIMGIIGNLPQVNTLISMDLAKGLASFKPKDCSK